MPPLNICLRASNGQYVCAERGGGGPVIANRNAPGAWEIFQINDLDGFPLQHDHRVTLQANSGLYVCAEGGGGGEVNATRPVASIWEMFTLLHADRSNGPITPGQTVVLRTFNGYYVSADGRGMGNMVALRNITGLDETFVIEMP